MDNNDLLKIENVSKSFTGVRALNNISFDVKKGEVHAIVGENGAGKSTLMNILSGVYSASEGKIFFEGNEIHFKDTRHAQQVGIAMIHQELSLASFLTVMENIYIGRLKKNSFGFIDYKKMYKECQNELDCMCITGIHPDQLVKELSISQMQIVEIIKAISLNTKLIIMDEPTSSLTKTETEMLMATIRSLKAKGISILYISHRMDEVFELADRITVLRDGEHIKTFNSSETCEKEILSLMVGREFSKIFERNHKITNNNDQPLLEVKNLSLKNKVKNISFKLYPGEVLALTGLVGSGRTELIQTIFGVNKKSSGEIFLNGEKIDINSPVKAINLGLAMVPEGRKTYGLFLNMTVRENITMVNLPKITKFLFVSDKKDKKNAKSYAENLRVKTPSIEQKVKFLSGGNQQKTIIARWLLNKPKILFLDEPTHGIDVGAKAEIYGLIDSLTREGVSIVLISSELPEVLTLADRILVMSNGSISGEISHEDGSQELIMEYATNQHDRGII